MMTIGGTKLHPAFPRSVPGDPEEAAQSRPLSTVQTEFLKGWTRVATVCCMGAPPLSAFAPCHLLRSRGQRGGERALQVLRSHVGSRRQLGPHVGVFQIAPLQSLHIVAGHLVIL